MRVSEHRVSLRSPGLRLLVSRRAPTDRAVPNPNGSTAAPRRQRTGLLRCFEDPSSRATTRMQAQAALRLLFLGRATFAFLSGFAVTTAESSVTARSAACVSISRCAFSQ